MYCPECGKRNPDDANYCVKCGRSLRGVNPDSPEQKQLEAEAQKLSPVEKRRKAVGKILLIGIILFIPAMIVLGFVFPIAIGYVWITLMFLFAWRARGKSKGDYIFIIGILMFLALMSTVTDIRGNHATHAVTKYLYCAPEDSFETEKVVYHQRPGETSVSYNKFCIKPDGTKEHLGVFKSLSGNALVYFSLALFLFPINYFINYLRKQLEPYNSSPGIDI